MKITNIIGILCLTALIVPPLPSAGLHARAAELTEIQGAANDTVQIHETTDDILVLPDKYNTGCHGSLKKIETIKTENLDKIAPGLKLIRNDDAYKFNFSYTGLADGEYVIENIDFSEKSFRFLGETKYNIHITFNNCKFSSFMCGAGVKATLNNCSAARINAQDVICNNCQFGHTFSDPIKAANNSYFNNCYITDLQYAFIDSDPNAVSHIDGVQISGNLPNKNAGETDGKPVENIHFSNCRFEIPTYYVSANNKATMNDCIFIQNEYSEVKNVTFENMVTNGANLQISIHRYQNENEKKSFPMKHMLSNISLKNIRLGEGSILGPMADMDSFVNMDNISVTDSLYIGSVWKDTNGIHISVTNDTLRSRKLTIVTDQEVKTLYIPAFPNPKETNAASSSYTYTSFPIDKHYAINGSKYIVCYDTTDAPKQIRFVNYSDSSVVIDKTRIPQKADNSKVVKSGDCGSKVKYTLTSDGILTISGEGAMLNYHSGSLPPWTDDYISKVIIENGVTTIGNQAFNSKRSIREVSLPSTLEIIGNRAFFGCSSLEKITVPTSVVSIGVSAFDQCFLLTIQYPGLNWNSIAGASAFTSMVRYITPDTQNRIVFEDIVTSDSNWIYTAAKFVYERNIMNGVGISPSQKPIFKPNSPITRGEFAQVLYNMVKRPKIVYSNVFTDVPKAQWYTNAVTWVYQNKMAVGKGGYFDVTGRITREEMLTMLRKHVSFIGQSTSATTNLSAFGDSAKVSSWAIDNVKWAVACKILSGKNGNIDPQGYATRAECATLIRNIYEQFGLK